MRIQKKEETIASLTTNPKPSADGKIEAKLEELVARHQVSKAKVSFVLS